jgi:acetoin utilization deacetylase AcuC-like enzyme
MKGASRPVFFYHDLYGRSLHPEARFPRERYWMVREAWDGRGLSRRAQLQTPEPATAAALLLAHDDDWVRRFLEGGLTDAEVRRIGFRPWTPFFVERTLTIMGGTLGALQALHAGAPVAGNLAGGTHHAFRAHGEGYCVFNDLALAARMAQANFGWRRVLILDLDVHQGNGTAALFAHDPDVYTVSVHGARNYPFRKQVSDHDVELPDGATDADLMRVLDRHLETWLLQSRPDVVFYQAGVDSLQGDRLGRLAHTRDGLQARNRRVYEAVQQWGCPLLVTMGGGYGVDIRTSVEAHVDVYQQAIDAFGR